MRGLERSPTGRHVGRLNARQVSRITLSGEPMKKVRLAMLSAAMFLGMATVAHAQDPQQAGRGNRPNMSAMLFQGITLSPAQEARRDSIEGKYREQMTALRNGGGDQQ